MSAFSLVSVGITSAASPPIPTFSARGDYAGLYSNWVQLADTNGDKIPSDNKGIKNLSVRRAFQEPVRQIFAVVIFDDPERARRAKFRFGIADSPDLPPK